MQGRIYSCHHRVPGRIVSTSLFSTFVSGVRSDPRTGLVGDLDGENIATPDLHSEMRHQYHVWQERLAGMDYVGFEHYRRVFFINPFDAGRLRGHHPQLMEFACRFAADEGCIGLQLEADAFVTYLDLREAFDTDMKRHVDRLMVDNDIITQRPQFHRMDEQFMANHSAAQWSIFVEIVRATRFAARSAGLIDFAILSPAYCNMYLMRTELFLEYMEFWWECMLSLETRIERVARCLGYFAERLINLFIHGKRLQDPGLRVRTLPYVIDGANA